MPSYMDDIALVAASKSVHENCQMLQKAAEQLINWGTSHHIQFDMKKTELIHFDHSDKSLKKSVKIMKNRIFPQEIVRWLGVWFDRKLSFKYHVEKRIADASRMFYSMCRLANTERSLSFQAMRRLYIACVTSIADFGVPVWWKNQQFLLDKFDKLQNSALQKILGAFKNSPVSAMEIEAALPPTKVRFEKLCKNYALRILQMQDSHPVKQRVTSNAPFFGDINLTKLNSTTNFQLAEWNQSLSYSESESEPEYHSQKLKKNRKTKSRKQRKFPSQLFRLCSLLKNCFSNNSNQNVENFNLKWNCPWKKSTIEAEIDSNDKIIAAENHRKLISSLQQNHSENILIYSDGSKLSEFQAGAGAYISYSIDNQQSYSW